tara:strand:+ start:1257 stop:1406 length:150 start_codon:yes stop_codon:yes gene_type:complete
MVPVEINEKDFAEFSIYSDENKFLLSVTFEKKTYSSKFLSKKYLTAVNL